MVQTNYRFLLMMVLAFAPYQIIKGQEPGHLTSARENFEREFVREVGLIQQKYVGALEDYRRKYTVEGNLKAATDANQELKRAQEWVTVPPLSQESPLQEPELRALQTSYESAATKVIDEVVARYLKKLEFLKKGFTSRNDLENSILVVNEAKAVIKKENLPRLAGAIEYLSSLDQDEFRKWLYRHEFKFSGKTAGVTKVKVEPDQVQYHPTSQPLPKGYSYEMKGNRGVDIGEGYFEMEFSKDLQTATFKSKRGEYPLSIHPLGKSAE